MDHMMSIKDFVDGFSDVVNVFDDASFSGTMKRVRKKDPVAEGWKIAGEALRKSAEECEAEQAQSKKEPRRRRAA